MRGCSLVCHSHPEPGQLQRAAELRVAGVARCPALPLSLRRMDRFPGRQVAGGRLGIKIMQSGMVSGGWARAVSAPARPCRRLQNVCVSRSLTWLLSGCQGNYGESQELGVSIVLYPEPSLRSAGVLASGESKWEMPQMPSGQTLPTQTRTGKGAKGWACVCVRAHVVLLSLDAMFAQVRKWAQARKNCCGIAHAHGSIFVLARNHLPPSSGLRVNYKLMFLTIT